PSAKVCLELSAVRSISVREFAGVAGALLLPKCATSKYRPSGERDSEPGFAATFIEVWMLLLLSDITSMRLAVKLAMYNTPRASSRARSEASPPIGTTRPNVPDARRDPLSTTTPLTVRNQDLRSIT